MHVCMRAYFDSRVMYNPNCIVIAAKSNSLRTDFEHNKKKRIKGVRADDKVERNKEIYDVHTAHLTSIDLTAQN